MPALVALLTDMYERSKYRNIVDVDWKVAKSLLLQAITRQGAKCAGGSCVFVIDRSGYIEGFIVGILDRVYHIGAKLMATDLFYYVRPSSGAHDAAKLFDAFVDWARSVPDVIEIRNGATDAIGDFRRVEKWWQRRGMKQVGVIYETWLAKPKEDGDVGRG